MFARCYCKRSLRTRYSPDLIQIRSLDRELFTLGLPINFRYFDMLGAPIGLNQLCCGFLGNKARRQILESWKHAHQCSINGTLTGQMACKIGNSTSRKGGCLREIHGFGAGIPGAAHSCRVRCGVTDVLRQRPQTLTTKTTTTSTTDRTHRSSGSGLSTVIPWASARWICSADHVSNSPAHSSQRRSDFKNRQSASIPSPSQKNQNQKRRSKFPSPNKCPSSKRRRTHLPHKRPGRAGSG